MRQVADRPGADEEPSEDLKADLYASAVCSTPKRWPA